MRFKATIILLGWTFLVYDPGSYSKRIYEPGTWSELKDCEAARNQIQEIFSKRFGSIGWWISPACHRKDWK